MCLLSLSTLKGGSGSVVQGKPRKSGGTLILLLVGKERGFCARLKRGSPAGAAQPFCSLGASYWCFPGVAQFCFNVSKRKQMK